jgi:HEAT repeat protein
MTGWRLPLVWNREPIAMAVSTESLLRLLKPDHPAEVRSAAAQVLGEIGGRDGGVSTALAECLADPDTAVRRNAIQAVGKLRIEGALPALLERIRSGGEEAELAAQAAARLGARGTRGLQDLMPKVAPGLRRYIAAALAGGGTASASAAAVAVLLDTDAKVVEAAVSSLIGQIPSLTPVQRRAWADQLLPVAEDHETPHPPATTAAVVRLLAALEDPRAEAVLWDHVLAPRPAEVRAAALGALGKWATAATKDHLQRLFSCAADADFRVAAPALMLLKRLPFDARSQAHWLTLLQAADVAARQLALEKIGDRDSAEVAEALLAQLSHPDAALRDAALGRLSRLKKGREELTAALLGAETADRAWALAKAQTPYAKDFPTDWREKVFDQAARFVEAGDRRADALLFLLRETDAADLRDRLEQRAVALRKKKAYPAAILYLRLLARDPALGFETRLELAACGLKVSAKDLAHETRAADPCLGQFANLIQQDGEELLAHLTKMKWLDADDLYYLGFHFAEQEGRPKKFAGDVLRLVVKRSARSKLGQAAKSKLRGAGLE